MLLSRSNKFDTTIFLTVSWGIAGWVRRWKEEVLIEVKRATPTVSNEASLDS